MNKKVIRDLCKKAVEKDMEQMRALETDRVILKARLHAANYNTKYIIKSDLKLNKKQAKKFLAEYLKHFPEIKKLRKNK